MAAPTIASTSSPIFAAVVLAEKSESESLEDILMLWQKEMESFSEGHVEEALVKCPEDRVWTILKEKASDYLFVLVLLQKNILSYPSFASAYRIVKAVDNCGSLQAMASYTTDKGALHVAEMLTAPSNLRWDVAVVKDKPSCRGSGVLLLHALMQITIRNGLSSLHLVASDTSDGFYEKMEMRPEEGKPKHYYYPIEDRDKIQHIFARTFGEEFSYTLSFS